MTAEQQNSAFWEFEKQVGVPVWENLLNLPTASHPHPIEILRLEQELGFTYVRSKATEYVFISEKTAFLKLVKYLPFLFEKYQLFLCPDHLIMERLRFLSEGTGNDDSPNAGYVLDRLLENAVMQNASDIHLESHESYKNVRLRVDGRLEPLAGFEDVDETVFTRIKLVAKMDIAQKRAPQDGHFHFIDQKKSRFDIRVSSLPSINGEKIVMRLLPLETINYSLKELGLHESHVKVISKSIRSKSGMILIAGPTGSGKTTTLYAILKELIKEPINIMTIENPVEYRLDHVIQVEVNEKAGVTFSNALKSFLRQDPDVILVGEIRDSETAEIAARAAQTGHMVLSTVHSNSVFEILQRLGNLGVSSDDLGASIKLMMSQRLLRKKCRCNGKENRCDTCNGRGYSGRIPVLELLSVDEDLRQMLLNGESLRQFESKSRIKGFRSLRENGEDLVEKGVISRTELNTVIL